MWYVELLYDPSLGVLGIFGLGPMELAVFAVVLLLLFGSRLPGMMRSLGKSVVEFKKGVSGIEDDPQRVVDQNERK